MNQTGGNSAMQNHISDTRQVKFMPFHELWLSLYQLTGPFFVHMPMMMSVLGPGSLGLMYSTLMNQNFAAPHGPQGQYVQLCDWICLVNTAPESNT